VPQWRPNCERRRDSWPTAALRWPAPRGCGSKLKKSVFPGGSPSEECVAAAEASGRPTAGESSAAARLRLEARQSMFPAGSPSEERVAARRGIWPTDRGRIVRRCAIAARSSKSMFPGGSPSGERSAARRGIWPTDRDDWSAAAAARRGSTINVSQVGPYGINPACTPDANASISVLMGESCVRCRLSWTELPRGPTQRAYFLGRQGVLVADSPQQPSDQVPVGGAGCDGTFDARAAD
jgi:hypothetical protein